MTAPAREIGGREITPPVRVRDGDQWSAQYFVPAGAAQALVRPAGLQVVQLLPRRAIAMITFARYRDTDLGPYDELVISFLVRRRDAAAAPGRRLPLRRRRGETCVYPHRLPTTEPLAVEAGRAIWGYPRCLAELAIDAERGRAECSLAQDGASVLRIEVCEGGPLRLTDPNLPNLSRRDGVLLMSTWEQQGPARARLGGADSSSARTRSRTSCARSACRSEPSYRPRCAGCGRATESPSSSPAKAQGAGGRAGSGR